MFKITLKSKFYTLILIHTYFKIIVRKNVIHILEVSICSKILKILTSYISFFLGNSLPQDICCMAADGRLVFAAYGNVFSAFARNKEVCITELF